MSLQKNIYKENYKRKSYIYALAWWGSSLGSATLDLDSTSLALEITS